MKLSDMNEHQKLAYKLMDEVTSEFIGGNENTMSDFEEDTEEWQGAKEFLSQPHDRLKEFIYNQIMFMADERGYAKHIRFAGKDFIMERIEKRLQKWGY